MERRACGGVIGLPLPLKVYDLLNTVEMMEQEPPPQEKEAAGSCEKQESKAEGADYRGESPFDGKKPYDRGGSAPVFAEKQYGQRHKYAGNRADGIDGDAWDSVM